VLRHCAAVEEADTASVSRCEKGKEKERLPRCVRILRFRERELPSTVTSYKREASGMERWDVNLLSAEEKVSTSKHEREHFWGQR